MSLFLSFGSRFPGRWSCFRSLESLNLGRIGLLFVRFDQLSLFLSFVNLLLQLLLFLFLSYDLEARSQFVRLSCWGGLNRRRRSGFDDRRFRRSLWTKLVLGTGLDGRTDSSICLGTLFLFFSLFLISDSLFFLSTFYSYIGFRFGNICSLSQFTIYFRVSGFVRSRGYGFWCDLLFGISENLFSICLSCSLGCHLLGFIQSSLGLFSFLRCLHRHLFFLCFSISQSLVFCGFLVGSLLRLLLLLGQFRCVGFSNLLFLNDLCFRLLINFS